MTNNFWAKRLGTPAPQQQQTVAPQPWWANSSVTPTMTQPARQPVNHGPVMGNDYSTTRAESAKLSERCPDCGSDYYFSATPNTMRRCYDCGYPVVQSASGDHAPTVRSGQGDLAATRQIQAGVSKFNPSMIIGKIE